MAYNKFGTLAKELLLHFLLKNNIKYAEGNEDACGNNILLVLVMTFIIKLRYDNLKYQQSNNLDIRIISDRSYDFTYTGFLDNCTAAIVQIVKMCLNRQ